MLENPTKDKMMKAPVIKKGYHFASNDTYYAEFIEAHTIEEATAIYHQIKRLINAGASPVEAIAQSTPPTVKQQEDHEV